MVLVFGNAQTFQFNYCCDISNANSIYKRLKSR